MAENGEQEDFDYREVFPYPRWQKIPNDRDTPDFSPA